MQKRTVPHPHVSARYVARASRRALLPATALVLLLAACTSPPGPLAVGMDTTGCFDSAMHTDVLVGLEVENSGTVPVVIDRVTFPTHEGITVHDVWLVDADPQDDGTTLGYGLETYPPDVSTRPSWDDRVKAEGASVPGEHRAFLAIRLERTQSDPVVDGVTVDYRVGGMSYTAVSNARYGFSSTGGDCTG